MTTHTDDDDDSDPLDVPFTPTTPGVEALTLRRPSVPVTLGELAARKGEALEIVNARVEILDVLRRASIRATHPEDWVLYKAPDIAGGQIVAFLEDAGCERVRALWGIRIYNVSAPEKVVGDGPTDFMILVTGDGECSLTSEIIEHQQGARSSREDFCKDKVGAALEVAVRKAARANLDGGIVRELAGLASVPIQELEAAFTGTSKTVDRCRRGRGFGTHDERFGARSEKAPDIEPPTCPYCKSVGVFRAAKGARGAFYGCPKYGSHPEKKWIVDAAEWAAQATKKPAPEKVTPPAVGEVFNK